MKANKLLLAAVLATAIGTPIVAFAEDESVPQPMASAAGQVHYQTAKIDGVDVFYREAGPKNAHKNMTEGELPSLAGATEWLNSPPLTAAGLRGKVVLIIFGIIISARVNTASRKWSFNNYCPRPELAASVMNWFRSMPAVWKLRMGLGLTMSCNF